MCLVSSLSIHNSTRKPRITKYMTSTPEPGASPTTEAPVTQKNSPLYRVVTNTGTTCILLATDAIIEIRLKSNIGDENIDTFVPDKAMVEGDCKYEDTETMTISWPGYRLEWNFAKTPGGERWYVDKITLVVSASQATGLHHYHTIASQSSTFRLSVETNNFPTPVGRSFTCGESVVELGPDPDSVQLPGLTGTLYLRELQVQPFMYKSAQFSSEFGCETSGRVRDETAPIAVGSTLAIAVLGMISGYGAWRYFKVKKVQYNTME